jgi:outer membrane protein
MAAPPFSYFNKKQNKMQDENIPNNQEESTEQNESINNPEENITSDTGHLFKEDNKTTETHHSVALGDHQRRPSRIPLLALIFSLIALAGFMFVLLTKGGDSKSTPAPRAVSTVNSDGTVPGTRVAFVRADSVQNNYLMTIHFLDSIEKRFRSMENDLMGKKSDYEKKINNYYRDIHSGLLKESAALQIKERIEKEGDDIARLEENYTSRINELQLKLNIIYFDSLWNFIDRHKAHFGVDMVVGYQQGLTNIFFADASMDITDEVIALMNEEYAAKYPNRKDLKKKKK